MGQFKFSNFNKKLTAATTANEQGAIKMIGVLMT